jgi:hypothetical protein
MRRQVLVLTTSALVLAYGAIAATAQGPMTPRPNQQQTQQQTTGEEGSMGQGGMMGCGMMGQGGMMGRSMMGRGMMGGRRHDDGASNNDAHDLRFDGRRW